MRGKGRQHLEFEQTIILDIFKRPTRELKGLAGEPVDRRLNAVGDFPYADTHAQRQRLKGGAQVQKERRKGGQLCGKGMEFVAGGLAKWEAVVLLQHVMLGC